jgi:hypothetical protein
MPAKTTATSARRTKRRQTNNPLPQRPGLVTLSLGEETAAMLRWLRRRYIMKEDGLPATSASEIVRDLVLQANRRTVTRTRD